MGKPTSLAHRVDIDGLRCVAVVSVLLYHLELETFAGGFFGVDVFFVISGYLITGLILSELEKTGQFRAKAFYLRRLRRLFPAYIAVIAGCLAIAIVLFTPQELKRLGASSACATLGVSNVFFWLESGYFDAAARLKPLLHTWSLGVEVQFYLLWPALIWMVVRLFGSRSRMLLAILFVCALGSFAGHVVFSDGFTAFQAFGNLFADGAASTFYLTPFRIFEFAIGAALLFIPDVPPKLRPVVSELGSALGLAMILYAVLTRDAFAAARSFQLLLPCVGAALLIAYGRTSLSAAFLRTRVAVQIGKMSYSIYLVHWPLIVFYDYVAAGPLDGYDKLLLAGLSLGAGALLHRFVEEPFRWPRIRAPNHAAGSGLPNVLGPAGVVLMVPVAALGSVLWAQQGWPWRVTDPIPVAEAPGVPCEDRQRQPCPLDGDGAFDTIWIGDSLAAQYAPVLASDSRFSEIMFSFGGCPMLPLMTRLRDGRLDQRCVEATEAAFSLIESTRSKNIVIALYWRAYFDQELNLLALRDGTPVGEAYGNVTALMTAALRDLHALAVANGHRVFIVDHVQDETLEDWRRCRNTPLRICSGTARAPQYDRLNAKNPFDPAMLGLFAELGFKYFNPLDNFCERDTGACVPLRDGSRAVMSDHIHFSLEGAKLALLGGRPDFFEDVMGGGPIDRGVSVRGEATVLEAH